MKTFAIIGTGAIGGYCAIKLMQAGFEVHCLLNSDYAYVKQNGLTLISDNKTVTLPVHAYQHAHELPKCDVIIVTLKTTANTILKKILPEIMHEKSIVVIAQNGIGIEEEISQFIAAEKIIGASVMLMVNKTSVGVVKHFGLYQIEFAQYYYDQKKFEINNTVKKLAEIFTVIGFDSAVLPHLPTMRWKKLVGNIPLNGLCVVMDAASIDLVNHPATYSLLLSLTREVIMAAKKCGADIQDDLYEFRLQIFEKIKSMEKNYPSMKNDFDAKKPLELHAIYENPIRIATENHVAMPLTEMLYQQLVYLNEKNLEKIL